MCLRLITNSSPKSTGYGYKVFRRYDNDLFSEIQGNSNELKRGVWLDQKEYLKGWYKIADTIRAHTGYKYPFGWHIFELKKDAQYWRIEQERYPIFKIKYKNAHTLGTQILKYKQAGNHKSGDIIVATHIRILKEVK